MFVSVDKIVELIEIAKRCDEVLPEDEKRIHVLDIAATLQKLIDDEAVESPSDETEWEKNISLSSMEIAFMALTGQIGDEACYEHILNALDICDDEAAILEQNIEGILQEEGILEEGIRPLY